MGDKRRNIWFERSYRDTNAPTGGMIGHINAKTPIIRTVGMISMHCDNCNMLYETHACWAKRTNHHFCSRDCHDKFRQIRIKKACVICGKHFYTTPTGWFKHITCSRKCLIENRRILNFVNKRR